MLLLALTASVWVASGCASGSKTSPPKWFSFGKKEESGPKVITPRDKIEQLRELATHAHEMSPELQERASNELAQGIAHEQDAILRAQILRTLANFRTAKAGTILVAGLHDHERDVRIAACESLGKYGGPTAAPNLSRALAEDSDLDVRLAAARGLGQTKDASAVSSLGEALEDQDPAMQHRAIASLKLVSGQDYGGDVEAWRQYAKTGQPQPQPSLAQRIFKKFW
jgi:HEAT repeat protein